MKERYDERIDRTLRALGAAEPVAGIEGRVRVRLARAEILAQGEAKRKVRRFFSVPQLASMIAAAGMVCAVIVAGSVTHSRRILPIAPGAPGLHLPGDAQAGVGAASAARVAAQPVIASPKDRPRSVRKTVNGRAVISANAKKHAGVVVPKETLSAQQQVLGPQQP